MPAADGTLITAPANTKAKMRFRETYTSEGLNRKLNGIAPHGVLRGFRLGTSGVALTVDLELDASTLDSIISYVDATGHQLTYRETVVVPLDLTAVASTTVFIAVYMDYTISGTLAVQWRAYTAAQLALETETVLIVGQVVVPAGGVISAASITPLGRQTAWQDASEGLREWDQVITNGNFNFANDLDAIIQSGVVDDPEPLPGWETLLSSVGANATLQLSTTAPRSGKYELELLFSGGAASSLKLRHSTRLRVTPGQVIYPSVWIRGNVVTTGGTALGIRVSYYDAAGVLVGSVVEISDATLLGTFAYTRLAEMLEVPATAYHAIFDLIYTDTTGETGSYFFDDFEVFVECGQVLNGLPRDDLADGQRIVSGIDFLELNFLSDTVEAFVRDIIQARNLGGEFVLKHRNPTADLLLRLVNGGIRIEQLIEGLGINRLSSAVHAHNPRIDTDLAAAATSQLTLLHHGDNPELEGDLRVYMGADNPNGLANLASLIITINASYDEVGNDWNRDAAQDSFALIIENGGVSFAFRLASQADGWVWAVGSNMFTMNTEVDGTSGLPNTRGRINKGRIEFLGTASSTDEAASSSTSATYIASTITSRSIVQGWCRVIGNAAGSADQYGMTPALLGGAPNDMRFTFHDPYVAADRYCFICTAYRPGATPDSVFAVPFNPTTTTIDVRLFDETGAQQDLDSSVYGLQAFLLGNQ